MRKIDRAHMFLLLVILLCGCSENEPVVKKTLTVSNMQITMSSGESSSALDISSNTTWQIESTQSWLTINPDEGSNNASLTITVEKNPEVENRMAELIISGTGVETLTVIVTQKGRDAINYAALGGPIPTKDKAILFAPGLVSKSTTAERVVSIAPDGSELFFMVRSNVGPRIWNSKFANNAWTTPSLASFSLEDVSTEPFISPNGKQLYFVSVRTPSWNPDIWVCNNLNGSWSAPTLMSDAINTADAEWHPSVAANGDLYFASEKAGGHGKADIYVSKMVDGTHTKNKNLGDVINTADNEWDPYVSPEGSYIIFKSDRAGGYGGFDMYVTVNKNGNWTTPQNLGPVINTNIDDDAGDVTPDGKYLIFARESATDMDIYWIHMDAIKDLLK